MYANVNTSQINQNYTGLLMGDVSGDWTASMMRAADPAVSWLSMDALLVSAPLMDASSGKQVTIPIRIDNLGGTSVSSYQFDIEYDPKVISPEQLAATLEGTMGSGLTVVSNSPVAGLLKVVVYGAIPVVGDGVYANVRFTVNASAGTSTPINITNIRINDGEKAITTAAGRITIR
jgi:hypothetical protein